MKRKYQIKKANKNPFSGISGIDAVQLSGALDCIVTSQKSKELKAPHKISNRETIPIKKYAYHLYTNIRLSDIKSVTNSCGVNECVKQEHLIATLK